MMGTENGGASLPGASSAVAPVTQERLKAILDSKNWHWFIDNEGDLGGIWDGNTFFFMLVGKESTILRVQGNLNRRLSMEHLDEVREFILEWHRDKLWPTAAHHITDDGDLRIEIDHCIDWEYGASDAQLLQQIECTLGTGNQFFEALLERVGE